MTQVEEADDVSVRAIAEAVGKTVPALYQHFTNKSALLTAAAEHALNAMATTVDEQVTGEPDIDHRLRARARSFVAFATEHPVPYRHLFMSKPKQASEPTDNALDLMMRSVGFGRMVSDLEEAKTAGLLIDEDPADVAIALFTAVHGVASLLISHPDLPWPEDLLERVLDQHAFGIIPR